MAFRTTAGLIRRTGLNRARPPNPHIFFFSCFRDVSSLGGTGSKPCVIPVTRDPGWRRKTIVNRVFRGGRRSIVWAGPSTEPGPDQKGGIVIRRSLLFASVCVLAVAFALPAHAA